MRSNEIIDSSKTNRFKSQNELNYNLNTYTNFPIKFEYPNINYAEDEKRINLIKNKNTRNHSNNLMYQGTSNNNNNLPQIPIFKTNIKLTNYKIRVSKISLDNIEKIENTPVEKRILYKFKNRSISSPLYKIPNKNTKIN